MPINHVKTNSISDWSQADLDAQIALGNFAPGTVLADIVLPSDWNDDHTPPDIADVTGLQAALDDKVTAPASTDNAIARFDGTSGNIQNSGVIIDDSDNITGASSFRTTGAGATAGTTNFRLDDSANRSMFEVNNAGFVGISCAPSALWKLDFTGQYFQMGSDNTSNNLRTTNTVKLFGVVSPAYDNTQNPTWCIGVQNTSVANNVVIGGGITAGANAATTISFATNSTTTGGVGATRMALTNTILRLGSGDATATPAAVEIRGPRVSGVADTAGVNQTYVAGLATGNANSGDHIWQSGTIGSSGSTIQTAATRMTLKGGTGRLGIMNTSPSALLSLGTAGTTAGTLSMAGGTSGTVTLDVPAAAGTSTLTLPAATDTLVGKATTDTLTNKTLTDAVITVATPTTTSAGYLGAPQRSISAADTFVITDAGKSLYHPAADTTPRTWTIPANSSVAFPIGTVILIINEDSAGAITLAITTDTLRWGSSTGTRTIAANGTASLLKVTSTQWRLTGDGIT